MDPAFLVWIPPIDETAIDDELEPHYEEILPHHSVDPRSNQETPIEEEEELPIMPAKHRKSLSNCCDQQNEEIRTLLAKTGVSEERRAPRATIEINKDLETAIIIKAASTDNRIAEYYGLSDIQFADDVDEMDDEVRYIDENKAQHGENKFKA